MAALDGDESGRLWLGEEPLTVASWYDKLIATFDCGTRCS